MVLQPPESTKLDSRNARAEIESGSIAPSEESELVDSKDTVRLIGFQDDTFSDVKVKPLETQSTELQSAAPDKASDAEPHAVQFDEVVDSIPCWNLHFSAETLPRDSKLVRVVHLI